MVSIRYPCVSHKLTAYKDEDEDRFGDHNTEIESEDSISGNNSCGEEEIVAIPEAGFGAGNTVDIGMDMEKKGKEIEIEKKKEIEKGNVEEMVVEEIILPDRNNSPVGKA